MFGDGLHALARVGSHSHGLPFGIGKDMFGDGHVGRSSLLDRWTMPRRPAPPTWTSLHASDAVRRGSGRTERHIRRHPTSMRRRAPNLRKPTREELRARLVGRRSLEVVFGTGRARAGRTSTGTISTAIRPWDALLLLSSAFAGHPSLMNVAFFELFRRRRRRRWRRPRCLGAGTSALQRDEGESRVARLAHDASAAPPADAPRRARRTRRRGVRVFIFDDGTSDLDSDFARRIRALFFGRIISSIAVRTQLTPSNTSRCGTRTRRSSSTRPSPSKRQPQQKSATLMNKIPRDVLPEAHRAVDIELRSSWRAPSFPSDVSRVPPHQHLHVHVVLRVVQVDASSCAATR